MKYISTEQMQKLKQLLAKSDAYREQSKRPGLTLAEKLRLRRLADATYDQAQSGSNKMPERQAEFDYEHETWKNDVLLYARRLNAHAKNIQPAHDLLGLKLYFQAQLELLEVMEREPRA